MLDRNADTVVSSVGPSSPGSAERKDTAWRSEAEQPAAKASAEPKLLDRLAQALRSRHYSRRTEQTYCHWVKRYIFFQRHVTPPRWPKPASADSGYRLLAERDSGS